MMAGDIEPDPFEKTGPWTVPGYPPQNPPSILRDMPGQSSSVTQPVAVPEWAGRSGQHGRVGFPFGFDTTGWLGGKEEIWSTTTATSSS
jgi:hypothetical protein